MNHERDDELRERVRRSLEIIEGERAGEDVSAEQRQQDLARMQSIVEQEIDQFYADKGLVKHISRTGRAYWVTPEEAERLRQRRHRRRRRGSAWQPFKDADPKVLAVWILTTVFAALLIAYLISTELPG